MKRQVAEAGPKCDCEQVFVVVKGSAFDGIIVSCERVRAFGSNQVQDIERSASGIPINSVEFVLN